MSISTRKLKIKRLQKSSTADAYKLYKSALEWDLTEPIVIEDRKDLKSEHSWKSRVEPYYHQVTNLMTFCRRLPVTLLADDVGLGKTISAGLVVSELIARGRVSKFLVVCPKLLMPQWREELDVKFGIAAKEVVGKDLILAKPPKGAGAIITTYASARLHFNAITKAGFEMLILDEAHKLRNLYGVEKAPQVAKRIRQALADRQFRYVLMLTATPIQNRLWDIYSLIDLLTVARGHENPFGSEGMFARNFIADSRTEARQLKPNKRDEFRSIVYSYMSRIRRVDAKLHFPTRKVQMHKVQPTTEEMELIKVISQPIQKLNRLAQISILQALVSSPHALAAQLERMALNRTVPASLANDVRAIVNKMGTIAKLKGLGSLVEEFKKEKPQGWRMVIFTSRRETQTTIEVFLREHGIASGLINGDSGPRNQETIARFKEEPPGVHVIVSTEAGSEGINLQMANVLVNFDLPWNPMIVEQRIGRIQRLASKHESVCIFNVILSGTFEEYIVGRLMEKLQMASQAIGDVEALLEVAGLDEEGEDSKGFAEKIRDLVISSLAGKNVEKATSLAVNSISEAKAELEREEKNINTMLAGGDGAIDLGPRSPKLPQIAHTMDYQTFAFAALENLGARLSHQSTTSCHVSLDGRSELIYFDENALPPSGEGTLCRPGSVFFQRLVSRTASTGVHQIEDVDINPLLPTQEIAKKWVSSFNGLFNDCKIIEGIHIFEGKVVLRVRATVAHDSYERLMEFECNTEGQAISARNLFESLSDTFEDPKTLHLPLETFESNAIKDKAVAEFCRFYQERLQEEIKATGDNDQKKKKLEDDFTPRIDIELVGIEGIVYRRLLVSIAYKIKNEANYESRLSFVPFKNAILNQPEIAKCDLSGMAAPEDCFTKCEITGKKVLRHMLVRSEISGRMALPEHAVVCSLSKKRLLSDEIEKSFITGQLVAKVLLKTSALSGKRAEPEYFGLCEFTHSEVFKSELVISEVSGKPYRLDQQVRSIVSGKTGHQSEFINCFVTNQPLLANEAEYCELTGKAVKPGFLENCEITGKKVLASELEKSVVSGKKALKEFFVTSTLSGARLLEQEAVRSSEGKYCIPNEAKSCTWSGRQCHLDDLRICKLTNVPAHFEYMISTGETRLNILVDMLNGIHRKTEREDLWDEIATRVFSFIKQRGKVEIAELSPDEQHLAVCLEIRTWLGLKVRYAGFIYSTQSKNIIGQITIGKRDKNGWQVDKD